MSGELANETDQYRCTKCGTEITEPSPDSAFQAIVSDPAYRRPFADLVFACPKCHAELEYRRKYFGILGARQVKVVLTLLIAAIALSVLAFLCLDVIAGAGASR